MYFNHRILPCPRYEWEGVKTSTQGCAWLMLWTVMYTNTECLCLMLSFTYSLQMRQSLGEKSTLGFCDYFLHNSNKKECLDCQRLNHKWGFKYWENKSKCIAIKEIFFYLINKLLLIYITKQCYLHFCYGWS